MVLFFSVCIYLTSWPDKVKSVFRISVSWVSHDCLVSGSQYKYTALLGWVVPEGKQTIACVQLFQLLHEVDSAACTIGDRS